VSLSNVRDSRYSHLRQTRETRRSTCRCPATIVPQQPMLSSIVQRSCRYARTIALWCRPKQWSPRPPKYSERSLQRRMASQGLGKSHPDPRPLLVWPLQGLGMDEGQKYVLNRQVIGAASAEATETISSSLGTSIPNPAKDCSSSTSSTWSAWSLFIAPTILPSRRRFPKERYYTHFCSLIRILKASRLA